MSRLMGAMLAQTDAPSTDPGLLDEAVLDEWTIPFGEWMDQSVRWIDQNLAWALDAFRWPFTQLLDLVVDGLLMKLPWLVVVIAFVVLGTVTRNLRVGIFSGVALTVCGLVGQAHWAETAKTIGFIVVAVLLCAIIGVPVGVLCGRFDSVWNVVRPALDAMQVIHAFVYMLPFVFFFGIGEEAATMVTMVFALPPLIRLTNLGIRSVPEDVVEAARAYGARELRVLTDVQLPLARPAIMTGLNQTLLLSISMLGVAAIMGAGGLGRLLFRAINNQDVALAASAGLAFFLVAVVLDRISQTEGGERKSFATRLRLAWSNLRTPEQFVAAARAETTVSSDNDAEGSLAPLGPREATGLVTAAVGGAVAAVSVVFTWSSGAGLFSGHARAADLDLSGGSASGLSSSGGSWFGYLTLGIGLFILLSAVTRRFRPATTARWASADLLAVASIALVVTVLGFLLAQPHPLAVGYSDGPGVWLALLGALVAASGALFAMSDAPYAPRRPLAAGMQWGRLAGGSIAVAVLVGSLFSGWIFDERRIGDDQIPPDIQVRIDELKAEAVENPSLASANANTVQSLLNQARKAALVIKDGTDPDGFALGWLAVVSGGLALLLLLRGAGAAGTDAVRRWRWSTPVAGVGMGLVALAIAIVGSTTRVSEPGFTTGVGLLLLGTGGFFLFVTSRSLLALFERSMVYRDSPVPHVAADRDIEEPQMVAD